MSVCVLRVPVCVHPGGVQDATGTVGMICFSKD